MPYLYGKNYTKEELLRRVGDISQIGGAQLYELVEGNTKGVQAVDFRTGTGFNFTALPGRGMDISYAEYQGQPLCWRSSIGDVEASYFEPEGLGWLRSFYGGLVVTCGLTYAGAPCSDEGEELGIHGRISHLPAKNVWVEGKWESDDYWMWAQGKMRETVVFGDNISLTRRISAKLGETRFFIKDVVENMGYEPSPFMILYHINGGFPAIDENAVLVSPTKDVTPRDKEAEIEADKYYWFQAPTRGFKERVYYHDMACDEKGFVYTALVNKGFRDGQGFGFYVKYKKDQLPRFIQWKMNCTGTYVVGMEPSNCLVGGRDKERAKGTLQFLEPGEVREINLEIGVLCCLSEIEELEAKVEKIKAGYDK